MTSLQDIEKGAQRPQAATNALFIAQAGTSMASLDNLKSNGNGLQLNTNGDGLPLNSSNSTVIYLPAFGGDYQPGLYKPSLRKFANPAPLGLCAFALTTFVLSIINANARGVSTSNVVVGLAYAYGGLVQLLAGMWEMAVGNTFGATALSSYGGFWISYAIIETASGFGIVEAYASAQELHNALGFYLIGWFIFTFLILLCTLKSTVAFCLLFVFVDMVFLLLAIANFQAADGHSAVGITKAAGIIGLLAAFFAWWCAFAGIADKTNSFFTIPVFRFPWSAKPEDAKTDLPITKK